ncbi:hypothetical protein WA171_001978 [Blastocystis sp. BT1]
MDLPMLEINCDSSMDQIVESFGFRLSEDGVALLRKENPSSKDEAIKFLLNRNIKEYGRAILPPNLNSATTVLEGIYLLQVTVVINVAAPSINQNSNIFPRLLKIRLTDGVSTVSAIEYESIQQLSLNTVPGTKVLITDPEFYNGSILLRPQHIRILGGVVPELHEAWKAQEMMAMKNRIRSTVRNAESHPPKFVSFEEFVKMKRRGITPSYQQSTTSVSTQLEVKKIEDLDLTDIQGKRKEALAGVDVKEAGKWGSNKQSELANKTTESRTKHPMEQPRHADKQRRPASVAPVKIVTKRSAKIIDMDVNETSRGNGNRFGYLKDLSFMLSEDKSIFALSAGNQLYAYLVGSQLDQESFQEVKNTLLGETYEFGIANENGSDKIVTIEGDFIIPPEDFEVPKEETKVHHAFFKRGPRGRGRQSRGMRGRGRRPLASRKKT